MTFLSSTTPEFSSHYCSVTPFVAVFGSVDGLEIPSSLGFRKLSKIFQAFRDVVKLVLMYPNSLLSARLT